MPASNMKILTAFAALDKLGPDAHLVTEARIGGGVGGIAKDGRVDGPLYLVGGGDPLLETDAYAEAQLDRTVTPPSDHRDLHTRLADLADAVAGAGVKTITGGIVGDDSRFDALRKVATWEPNYQPDGEVGPLGALMVDDGMTVLPPATALAPDPAIHAATVFAGMLRERGITVGGGESHAVAPAGATPVASLPSAAVRDIVGEMMRQSDNTTAEVLLKELGYRFGGAGSSAAGATVVHDALAARNLPVSGLVMHDGSGLDRGDRVTCDLLAGALVADGRRSPLADGLAVPGMPGTLQKRFVAGVTASLKDRLRGKTGTLKGVSALSGWIDAPPGATVGPLTFSLVANGLPKAALGPALADKVAAALATFPSAPSLEALGPKPAVAS